MYFNAELPVVLCINVFELVSLDVSVIEGNPAENLVEVLLADRLVEDNLINLLLVV